MATSQEFAARVDALLQPWTREGAKAQEQLNTPKDVKRAIAELSLVQKELRLIKKEIVLEKKEIRAEYAGARADVSKGAVGNRFIGGGFFGKMARAGTANKRVNLQKGQQNDLAPYEALEGHIEDNLIALDRMKIELEREAARM